MLPEELFPDVFSYLQAPSLLASGACCRAWNRLSKKPSFWRTLCKASWGISPDELATPPKKPRRRRARSEDGAASMAAKQQQEPKSPLLIYRRGHDNFRQLRRQILNDQRMLAARAALPTVPIDIVDRMCRRRLGRSRAWSFG